ncbi:hypothetical protein Ddc_23659 [Ditylenchus destructor]|nr:hypothetical protein Ddc_23659 [Ditylenchus destructor]
MGLRQALPEPLEIGAAARQAAAVAQAQMRVASLGRLDGLDQTQSHQIAAVNADELRRIEALLEGAQAAAQGVIMLLPVQVDVVPAGLDPLDLVHRQRNSLPSFLTSRRSGRGTGTGVGCGSGGVGDSAVAATGAGTKPGAGSPAGMGDTTAAADGGAVSGAAGGALLPGASANTLASPCQRQTSSR